MNLLWKSIKRKVRCNMSIKALEKGANEDIVMRDVNCDIFVIPNKGGLVKNYFINHNNLEKRMKEICAINDVEFDPESDKLFQFWATNDSFENMNDLGFNISYNGYRYSFKLDSVLPAKLFQGRSEKDIVTVTIPMKARSRRKDGKIISLSDIEVEDEEEKFPVFCIDFNFELNQQAYRYRNFGKFENALRCVIA